RAAARVYRPRRAWSIRTENEAVEEPGPAMVETLIRVRLGDRPAGNAKALAQRAVTVHSSDGAGESVHVIDVREQRVLAVARKLRGLTDACRDQGDARGHRLEQGLRPALLSRRHEIDVERVVGIRELVARGEQHVSVSNAEALELPPDVPAREP